MSTTWNKPLAETSLEEIKEHNLTPTTFEDAGYAEDGFIYDVTHTLHEQSIEIEQMSNPSEIDAGLDWNLLAKCQQLVDNAGCGIFEGSLHRSSIYQIELSWFARIELAHGLDADRSYGSGALDYDRSYENLKLIIEDIGDIFAVYLKDYEIGYMRPFGKCVYMCSCSDEVDENDGDDPQASWIEGGLLPYLWLQIWSGEINLEQEVYDYYHDIPDAKIPSIERRINDLVTVQEAASMLGVSASRVKKMVSDRVIDGFKRSGRVWLSRDQVQERIDYIAEHGKPTRGKAKE